jgi:hypothetical protein
MFVRLARGLLVAAALSASLTAAVSATAGPAPLDDGTLTVRAGSGAIVLRVKGSIIGRLGRGTVTVTEASTDGATVVVRGADKPPRVRGMTTAYTGTNIRFRIAHDKRITVKLHGKGINFSAVGRGDGWIDGAGDPAAGIFFDGSYSLNGEPYYSLPDERTRFELVLPQPSPRQGD